MGSGTFYFLFSVIPLKNGIHPSMDWERWIPYKVQSELDFYGMLKINSRGYPPLILALIHTPPFFFYLSHLCYNKPIINY